MAEDLVVFRSQLLTGSSLAAAFGRGRHRGHAELTADRLSFRTHSGEEVFGCSLAEIVELSVSKLGVLTISASTRVRICLDDQAMGDNTVSQAISTVSGVRGINDFAAEVEARRKRARS